MEGKRRLGMRRLGTRRLGMRRLDMTFDQLDGPMTQQQPHQRLQ
jgi:hypothetical protein